MLITGSSGFDKHLLNQSNECREVPFFVPCISHCRSELRIGVCLLVCCEHDTGCAVWSWLQGDVMCCYLGLHLVAKDTRCCGCRKYCMCTFVFGCKRHQVSWLYLVAKGTWCRDCTWLQKAPDAMIVPGCKRHMMPWLYLVAEDTACAHLCLVAKDTRCHGCTWFQKTLDAMVVPGCRRHLLPWLYLVAKGTCCHGCTWLQKAPDAMVVSGCRRHSVYCCAGLCLNGCKRHQVLWLYVVTKDVRFDGCTRFKKSTICHYLWWQRTICVMVVPGWQETSVWWLYLVGKRHLCDGCTWLARDIHVMVVPGWQETSMWWLYLVGKRHPCDGCTWLVKDIQSDGCTWLIKVDHMLLSVVANNVQCDGCT